MDWQNAQLVIAPALVVFFQALKKALGDKELAWIPLASLCAGLAITVLWTAALGYTGAALLGEAALRGAVIGAGAVGLYELGKDTVGRIL